MLRGLAPNEAMPRRQFYPCRAPQGLMRAMLWMNDARAVAGACEAGLQFGPLGTARTREVSGESASC